MKDKWCIMISDNYELMYRDYTNTSVMIIQSYSDIQKC